MSAKEKDPSIGPGKVATRDHINVPSIIIRQSISFLLLKLVTLELIAAVLFTLLHPVLFSQALANEFLYIKNLADWIFLSAVIVKLYLTVYVVLAWINNFYEITPLLVRHRSGIVWVHKEQLSLDDIQSITVDQGILGKILNFGTLSLYDWKWRKDEFLYSIHSPTKYVKIIEELLPNLDEERHIIREHLMEEE